MNLLPQKAEIPTLTAGWVTVNSLFKKLIGPLSTFKFTHEGFYIHDWVF